MSDPRFKTIKYGRRGRDWDMQIALTGICEWCGHSLRDHRWTGACLALVPKGIGLPEEICPCSDYFEGTR